MKNINLKRDFDNIVTEVRLGNVDDSVGRVVIEAENYINYLEGFEERARKFEDKLDQLSESSDPVVQKFVADNFKEFENA